MRITSVTLVIFIATIASLVSLSAFANPWLLPPGTIVISGRYDYAYADQEFLASDGKLTDFSLNGEYQASSYTLGARIGITHYLELEVSLPFKSVSYEADPLILLPTEADGLGALDYYQENIINFNQTVMGFGDLSLAGRFKTTTYPIASSLELKVVAPTGYRGPEGTFGNAPTNLEDFVENVGDLARPENIRDDVTLGDGVFSFQPLIHLGFGTASGFFSRLSFGLQLRNQGAGDLVNAEAKIGQLVLPWLLVYGGAYYEETITSGRSIGVSVAAVDSSLPATEYVGLNNLKPIVVTLDRDLLVLPVGVLFKPLPSVDLTLSYSPILWGRNVAKSHTVSVGVNILNQL